MGASTDGLDLGTVKGCRAAAARLLAGKRMRWRHVCGVAGLAGEVADALGLAGVPRSRLLAAAWLHDVGYAPALRRTGFHPLDGAIWLRERGQERLARLVAHHSGADVEARLRGLSLAEFPRGRAGLAPLLDYADICTGPDGDRVDAADRLAEVMRRHPPGSPVHEATRIARAARLRRAARVQARLAAAASGDAGRAPRG